MAHTAKIENTSPDAMLALLAAMLVEDAQGEAQKKELSSPPIEAERGK